MLGMDAFYVLMQAGTVIGVFSDWDNLLQATYKAYGVTHWEYDGNQEHRYTSIGGSVPLIAYGFRPNHLEAP